MAAVQEGEGVRYPQQLSLGCNLDPLLEGEKVLQVKDFLADQTVLRSSNAPVAPLVSIVLPTYRRYRSGQLQRALESVLTQTFEDFEFLVIDDGSTDGSADLIEKLRAQDARVVHVRHERNCGLPGL